MKRPTSSHVTSLAKLMVQHQNSVSVGDRTFSGRHTANRESR